MERRSDWNHYEYVYGEGARARVDFDVMAAVLPDDEGKNCLRVVCADDMVPAVEGALAAVEGRLVGTLAYAGQQEWVVWTDLEQVPASLGSRVGVQAQLVPGRDYTADRVFPDPADWRRIEDREAIQRLGLLDLDGDGILRVLHRFVGSEAALGAIAERLASESFTPVDRGDGRMTLAHEHPIERISEITLGLQRLSEARGVAYDGWVLPG